MDNKIAILTMAIAAVTMLIALGQLIVAIKTLNIKKTPPKRSWIGRNMDWFMVALLMSIGLYGLRQFLHAPGAPTREEISTFSGYLIVYSMAFPTFLMRFAFMAVSKHRRDTAAVFDELAKELDYIHDAIGKTKDSLQ